MVDLQVEVLTLSDSRAASLEEGRDEDKSGKLIQRKLKDADITSNRTVIPDEEDLIREKLEGMISDPEVDAIITTGGTGITSRDKTINVARDYFELELKGFGELLRRKSRESIGEAAILTRATAGIANRKAVFCLPGSPNSVEISMDIIASGFEVIMGYLR